MAESCSKARDFFEVIQRIYTIFANSTKRWQILKDNVKGLTPKSLSSTHWESRVDNVKAIRFQISEFREAYLNCFYDALNSAKKIAIDMNIDPIFPQRRTIRRKRQFDENLNTPSIELSGEESFRINYFFYLVDQAIVSLTKRFEQYEEYENILGCLFTSDKLQLLDSTGLKSCCSHFEKALKHNEQYDIDGNVLYVELKLLREILPREKMRAIDILKFLKGVDCFPNTIIAYIILLTIPVIVASAERSFSKLKLLKSYLQSTMLQERLNGLALIVIENDVLETVKYEEMVDEFASKSMRRMAFFK
ncbi:uncharacterized protein LOC133034141 [Cannabis sativa]|uniref:uncharacterized protein LOC133034141 n=1 Tax=Cannabis sativa TaxID=3483 RepID=UPI0029CA2213|nr:uncharacterized protein LOC133034141 [Cannabis sativa]